MRRGIILFFGFMGFSAAASAQTPVGTFGACMLETAAGEAINIGSCERRAAECNPSTCTQVYHWQRDDFDTILVTNSSNSVQDAVQMNGQEAYAPLALVQGDPRDCVYNAVTDGVFCFVDGADAQAYAVDGLSARDMLIRVAGAQGNGSGATDHGGGTGAATDGKKGSGGGVSALLSPFQGKYRPMPNWDCGEIGRDGGATAIEGDTLFGLESACRLTGGVAVGAHGAALFNAQCSGEGETWQDEYILRRDDWGSLAVLRSDGVTIWQSCD